MARHARQDGVEFLVYNLPQATYRNLLWFEGPAWTARQLTVYRAFARAYLTEVFRSSTGDDRNGFFYVYRVAPRRRPVPGPLLALPCTEGLGIRTARALRHGDRADIRDETRALLAAAPDVAPVLEQAGLAYQILGDWASARRCFAPLAAAGYDGEVYGAALAADLVNLGRAREAFPVLRRAFRTWPDRRQELRPPLAIALLNLGWAWRDRDPARARALIERARVIDPGRGEIDAALRWLEAHHAPRGGTTSRRAR